MSRGRFRRGRPLCYLRVRASASESQVILYFNGVANVFDSEWKGSAEDYVPGHPEAKYLYAWKVARRSNGDPHCLEAPTGPSHYGIGSDERVWLFFRVYLERATRVAPAWNELVLDRVIKFSPKR